MIAIWSFVLLVPGLAFAEPGLVLSVHEADEGVRREVSRQVSRPEADLVFENLDDKSDLSTPLFRYPNLCALPLTEAARSRFSAVAAAHPGQEVYAVRSERDDAPLWRWDADAGTFVRHVGPAIPPKPGFEQTVVDFGGKTKLDARVGSGTRTTVDGEGLAWAGDVRALLEASPGECLHSVPPEAAAALSALEGDVYLVRDGRIWAWDDTSDRLLMVLP